MEDIAEEDFMLGNDYGDIDFNQEFEHSFVDEDEDAVPEEAEKAPKTSTSKLTSPKQAKPNSKPRVQVVDLDSDSASSDGDVPLTAARPKSAPSTVKQAAGKSARGAEKSATPVASTSKISAPASKQATRPKPDPALKRQFPWSAEVFRHLSGVFKLPGFRTNQLEAINATLAGKDVFVLMPTGALLDLCLRHAS